MIRGKVIATGIEAIGKETVCVQVVNREQQAVFLITDVANSDFLPACGNPSKEPIRVGQYLLWDMSHAIPVCEESDTPHSKVRTTAADKYLKASNKQLVNFDVTLINTTSFRHGHTVELPRIDEVDRTNTVPRLLPCQVLEI